MRISALLASIAFLATPALAAPSLPGGATSLDEVHDSWTVHCAVRGEGAAAALECVATQRQVGKTNPQQLLAIELTPADKSAKGVLALPLGVDLAKGVVMQVDAGPSTAPSPYSTCLPAGCLVPLNFDAPNLKLLRAGKVLNAYATAMGGKAVKFAVPLAGLAPALDRATALLAGK